MNFIRAQHSFVKILLAGLTALILCTIPVEKNGKAALAHAQLGPISVTGGINVTDIGLTLTNTLSTIAQQSLQQKEFVLDPLFYQIAQMALQQLTSNILKFINSGFDGDPAFITDLDAYYGDAEDTAAGNFIYGGQTNTLCAPFQVDVQVALTKKYSEESQKGFAAEGQCTVEDPSVNMDAFLAGSFDAGGFSTWFEAVLNPVNTPIGAYAAATVALNDTVAQAKDNAKTESLWNDGFKSQKVCTNVSSGLGSVKNCTITDPGSLIKDQASFALQIPALDLLNANEFNETVGALFSNLATQAFSGVNGLLGLGGNASYSDNSFGSGKNSSYLDAVGQASVQNSQLTTGSGSQIAQALTTETQVLQSELDIVSAIDDVTTTYDDAKKPFASSSCWTLAIPAELTTTLNQYVAKVPVTVQTVVTLQDLSTQYDQSTSASGQLNVLQQLTQLQANGKLEGETALVQNQFLLTSVLQPVINTFNKDISDQKKKCQ